MKECIQCDIAVEDPTAFSEAVEDDTICPKCGQKLTER